MEHVNFEYDFHKHYKLALKKTSYMGKGLSGLLNLGNKCFMNSILQCLSNNVKLTDYMISGKAAQDVNKERPEYYMYLSYFNLLNHLWDTNQILRPKTFVENISKFHKKYFTLQQQDSHEFLLYFLDLLHKSVAYEIEIDISGEIKYPKDVLMRDSIQVWKKFYEKDYSMIVEYFHGMTKTDMTCNSCNFNEKIFEPYNSLGIDLNYNTLQDCLTDNFRNEIVNDWKCEKCNELGGNKYNKIWTLPETLIINLKRFKNKSNAKNEQFINYPIQDLDLSSLISQDKQDPNVYIYDLYAVNYHHGDLNGGHYWSACKNLDETWYGFNDANVYKFNNTEQIVSKDAYILFYRRKYIKKKEIVV
jgi:ubiquitin carboxyl-terminal hydrolase 8